MTFSLEAPRYVSVVVEDNDGHRVRNLIQNTFFSSGEHTIYWDGYDVGVPTDQNQSAGNYSIERSLVEPGSYRAKALVHDDIQLRYAFSVQSPGDPPWHTLDATGGWLSDHQTAWDVTWLPAGSIDVSSDPVLLFTAKTAEAGDGIMLVDEDGHKLYGVQSLPGGFFAGHNVARDMGQLRDSDTAAYIATVEGGELRIYPFSHSGKVRDLSTVYPVTSDDDGQLKGLAVFNGVAAASLDLMDRVVFLSLTGGQILGEQDIDDPRGIYVTEDQYMYVVEGNTVYRYEADFATGSISNRTLVIDSGLEDPQSLILRDNLIYVSDWGTSHQVKVYDLTGTLLRTIGTPGGPQIGHYDETRMALPRGIAVDDRGQLWVAELNKAPKRISRWDSKTGAFDRAWYGPPKYGGGGMIDPEDSTRFYYAQSGKDDKKRAYEFSLDWSTGESRVSRILLNDEYFPTGDVVPYRAPEFVRYAGGRQYMANNNQEVPKGNRVCGIWLYENERLWPVSVAGIVNKWDIISAAGEWQAYDSDSRRVFFVWSDLDRDGRVSPGETQYRSLERWQGTCFVEKDLSVSTIWGHKIPAPVINGDGVPVYDLGSWMTIAPDTFGEDTDSYHISDDSLFISLLGPISFLNHGELVAQYHSQWPNRNFGGAPVPVQQYPGQLVNTGRPLGDLVSPGSGEAGPILGINGEYGNAYLMTWDGIYITQLLEDTRTHPLWRFASGQIGRDDLIEGVSANREQFWPTLNATHDGVVYFVAGKEHSSILRVDGLESVERLDLGSIQVTSEMLDGKPGQVTEDYTLQEKKEMTAQLTVDGHRTDGVLSDWNKETWVTIDEMEGVKAALAADDDSLYLAVQSEIPDLLNNSGQDGYQLNFSTGGGIDLWLGVETANKTRTKAVEGDFRLFITREGADPENGPLRATLSEKVAPDAPPEEAYTYESAIDQVMIESVRDVTISLAFRQNGGDYEAAVPLSALRLAPDPGNVILGDIGVVIGDGVEAKRRIYWNNKSWVTVSDIAREAEFKPEYLGLITIVPDDGTTGTATEDNPLPTRFRLDSSYPNPVQSIATIRYQLAESRNVQLDVYDVLGRRVARLVDAEQKLPGRYVAHWDAHGTASGIYIYRLVAGDFVAQKTVVVIK